MIYDIHAHCVPEALFHRLVEGGVIGATIEPSPRGPIVDMGGFRTLPVGEDLVDLDRRLAVMDRQGVDVQILSPFVDLLGWELDLDLAVAWSRSYNEALVEEADRVPERFLTLATVPIQDGEAAASELRHAIKQLGMVGVELGTHVGDRHLDAPDLDPFWDAASELEAIVLLHPRDPLGPLPIDDFMIRHLVGRPADTTLAAARLLLSGMLERFPGVNVVVAHGGGFLPYQIGRLGRGFARPNSGIVAEVPPAELLRHMYYDTILNDPRAIRALIELVGADRVVIGTDYPYGLGDDDPVGSVDAVSGLTEADRSAIAGGNIERLLSRLRD